MVPRSQSQFHNFAGHDYRVCVNLHAVLVTYRRPEELGATLTALQAQTRKFDTIVVVDNDPGGGAISVATTAGVDYVAAGSNTGPAGGLSIGVRRLLETAADDDLIAFVDDGDPPASPTVIADLLALLGSMKTRAKVGAVGYVGARYDAVRGRTMRVPDSDLVGVVDVDWIGGGQFPLYLVAAIREVGPPDESLFFGFDDLEFCLRLRAAGWRIVVDGERWLTVRSSLGRLGQSPGWGTALGWRRYYSNRNLVLVARKHATRRGLWWSIALGAGRSVRLLLSDRRGAWLAARGTGARGITGRTVEPGY